MAFVLGVLQVASSPGVKGFVGCPTNIAYFPEHKVVLCTIPKSSSSTWREFARRVQAVDSGLTRTSRQLDDKLFPWHILK